MTITTRLIRLSAFCFLLAIFSLIAYAQETITITTYYPAPFGVYNELRAKKIAIGDNYYNPSLYTWSGGAGTPIDANADLIVEGNVGIGTVTPAYPLDTSRSTDGDAIHGTATGLNGYGVYGSGPSAGVYGTSTYAGVKGYGTADSSSGVMGYGTTTNTMGVYGNGNPYGVYAYGTTYGVMGRGGGAPDILPASSGVAGAGATYGVYGSGPTGVYGDGTATYGVYGTGPIGMCGEAAGASPIGYDVSGSGIVGNGGPGVYGITAAAGMIIDGLSDTGVVGNGGAYGVFGFATSGDGVCGRGTSYGVSGYGEGTGNGVYGMGTIGVYGHSTSIDNNDYGVKGDGGFSGGVWGDSTNALGVYGSSTNGVGVKGYSETHEGIYGWSFTDLGDGILGYNSNGKGVDGRSDSGFGIYGEASGSTVDHNIYPYTGVAGTGLNYGGVFQGAIGVVSNGTTLVSFLSNGDGTNFLAQGPGVKYATFTGAHDCLLPKDYSAFKPGVIVCVTGETRLRKDSRDEISLSYTLPTVKLANSPNDKTILGVFVKKFDLDSHWYKGKEQKGFVNAVGEGRVWVCDINGPIEAGDYITTSYAAGYGQKQNDDLVHNYTLGKATENVDWNKVTDTVEYQGKKYKAYLIAAVYTSG